MKKKLAVVLFALFALSQGSALSAEWNGFYAGLYTDQSFAWTQTKFDAGVLAGARFTPFDRVVLGVEAQAGTTLNSAGRYHAYLVGTAGFVLEENTLVYALLGAGTEQMLGTSVPTIKAGIGLEYALNQTMHVRGEIYAARDTISANTFFGLRASALFQFR